MKFEIKQNDRIFEIFHNDNLFTVCNYSDEFVRPFMGPIYTSFGKTFTRFAPFHDEHPHQRSVFVGIGDVNGIDFWNEKGEGKGKMVFDTLISVTEGETASLEVKLIWKSIDDDKPYLDEIRKITFVEKENCIAVSISIKLTASYEDIKFGKTKEAGPLGIRVTDEIRADRGGTFENSEGGINEEFCWSKEALWCNYFGIVDGKKIGITCYDDSNNERYPTSWHIRNYGLMAPNNLFFKGGYDLPLAETAEYNYLICFWEDTFDPEIFQNI